MCIFHLWDTWKEEFNQSVVESALREIPAQYPRVKASVENMPTRLLGYTPSNWSDGLRG